MDDKRVILITGTSAGIGKHLADHYVKAGDQVIGCSRRDVAAGPGYRHFALDVANDSEVRAMFTAVRREYGRLDVLINNAGVFASGYVMTAAAGSSQELLNTNLLGTIICSREAAKIMQKRSFGRIVNISSVAVPLSTVGNAEYSAAKAGAEQFARVLARELFPLGITVNVLGLSIVDGVGMADQLSDESVADVLKRTVLDRTLAMSDVTHAMDFLISEESSAVTSQTLYLGGA